VRVNLLSTVCSLLRKLNCDLVVTKCLTEVSVHFLQPLNTENEQLDQNRVSTSAGSTRKCPMSSPAMRDLPHGEGSFSISVCPP
jgi:hypothetical protein